MLLGGERRLRVRIQRERKYIKAQLSLLAAVNNTSLMVTKDSNIN